MGAPAFIAGALTGATGLIVAALWDKSKTEAQFSPALKTPGNLDATQTAKELNSYYFRAQKFYMDVNDIMLRSNDLISTPIDLPEDDIFQKAGNFLGGKATLLSRKWCESQLRSLGKEVKALYKRYQGVFEHANLLVKESGGTPENLQSIRLGSLPAQIASSLDNDNWDQELDALADVIRAYIDNSCAIASSFIERLEAENGHEQKESV